MTVESNGILYIVATPIGNLDDISLRALNILQDVDVVAAEDTRHSKKLLDAHQINTPMLSLHEHNEVVRTELLLKRLTAGENVALVSDAGTPLISDPGYVLVRQARAAGLKVVPVPGACAAISALSASGLPTDRFLFVGFLPQKMVAREQALKTLLDQTATIVCYESPRRIMGLLSQLHELAPGRSICLAKELTKTFENFFSGNAESIAARLEEDPSLQKGEWVVIMRGAEASSNISVGREVVDSVELAAKELPLKKACELVAKLSGYKKNQLYQAVLAQRA